MNVDWNACALCKDNTTEKLRCPKNNLGTKDDGKSVYEALSERLIYFRDNCLDIELPIWVTSTETKDSLYHLLYSNSALWHHSCFGNLRKKYGRLQQRKRKQLDTPAEPEQVQNSKKSTRSSLNIEYSVGEEKCFFCSKPATRKEKLTSASTDDFNDNVADLAKKLNDTVLSAKLISGDLNAQEAMYHLSCYVKLRNSARKLSSTTPEDDRQTEIINFVFAQLIDYMKQEHFDSPDVKVFKLIELYEMYKKKLKEFEIEHNPRTWNFKHDLLEACEDLHAFKQGKFKNPNF